MREFSYYLLYHFPHLQYENMQAKFNNFEWENSNKHFEAWKKGCTGYPNLFRFWIKIVNFGKQASFITELEFFC